MSEVLGYIELTQYEEPSVYRFTINRHFIEGLHEKGLDLAFYLGRTKLKHAASPPMYKDFTTMPYPDYCIDGNYTYFVRLPEITHNRVMIITIEKKEDYDWKSVFDVIYLQGDRAEEYWEIDTYASDYGYFYFTAGQYATYINFIFRTGNFNFLEPFVIYSEVSSTTFNLFKAIHTTIFSLDGTANWAVEFRHTERYLEGAYGTTEWSNGSNIFLSGEVWETSYPPNYTHQFPLSTHDWIGIKDVYGRDIYQGLCTYFLDMYGREYVNYTEDLRGEALPREFDVYPREERFIAIFNGKKLFEYDKFLNYYWKHNTGFPNPKIFVRLSAWAIYTFVYINIYKYGVARLYPQSPVNIILYDSFTTRYKAYLSKCIKTNPKFSNTNSVNPSLSSETKISVVNDKRIVVQANVKHNNKILAKIVGGHKQDARIKTDSKLTVKFESNKQANAILTESKVFTGVSEVIIDATN